MTEEMKTEVIETQEAIVETEETKKKPRATKARKIEELIEVPVKKMTEKEKEIFIEALQEELNKAVNQAETYKKLAEVALKEKQEIEKTLESINDAYQKDYKYISGLVQSFGNAIIRVTGGNK